MDIVLDDEALDGLPETDGSAALDVSPNADAWGWLHVLLLALLGTGIVLCLSQCTRNMSKNACMNEDDLKDD